MEKSTGEWGCLFHHGDEWRPSFLFWLLIVLSLILVPAFLGIVGIAALAIAARSDYVSWNATERVEQWLEVVPDRMPVARVKRMPSGIRAPPPPPGDRPPWQVNLR